MGVHYSGVIQIADEKIAKQVASRLRVSVETSNHDNGDVAMWVVEYTQLKLSPTYNEGPDIVEMLKGVPFKWSWVSHDYPTHNMFELLGELWDDSESIDICVNVEVSLSW